MGGSNIGTVEAIIQATASGHVDRLVGYVHPDGLIQHDPDLADGLDGLREGISGRSVGAGPIEIVRVIEDGDLVVVHGRDDGKAEVFFAALRFRDGHLAEHWRFASAVAPPNGSNHTQTDGPTHPDDREDTTRNKALIRDYYETVHIAGRHGEIGRYMSGDRQVRHEPGVHDGVTAFERDLAVLTRSRTIDEIVLFAGQGDLVFIAARGTRGGEPCAYIDLYRAEAGKLVEHWGFPLAIPPRNASKNVNGML